MKFEEALAQMPENFQSEIIETDAYLKALRPVKFRRTVDKSGKITYVASEYGISYMFRNSDEGFSHNFQWYIVYNGKPETWHRRRADGRTLAHDPCDGRGRARGCEAAHSGAAEG